MQTLVPIIYSHDKREMTSDLVGGKALGLHKLGKLSLNVPKWGAISTEFFEQLKIDRPKLKQLLKEEEAEAIRSYIKEMTFISSEEEVLRELWSEISKRGEVKVAVRSSAADEDSEKLSFAGQMDSFLEIANFSDYLEAIKGCFASLYGDRAVAYRKQNGIDPWQAKIAVIVQEMVAAEVSGVVFTANPISGRPEEVLITSIEGLGEALVSGQVDADTYTLDRKGMVLEKEIISDTINAPQLALLTKKAIKIEEAYKMPLDIEFSIVDGEIYFLQARPITTFKKKDNYRVWDNSNIVESYSGVTTPLTFSFIRNAYYAVYWQFCETLGIDRETIFRNRNLFHNMLGLIQGRVYYNLLNWYKLVSLMPGFDYNKEFMEQMMGLQVVEDRPPLPETGKLNKYFKELPRLLKVACKMIVAHLWLPKKIQQFHANFARVYKQYAEVDYANKTPAEILAIYRTLEEEMLWKWRSPITNDFEAMIFYGLLKKLTVRWDVDSTGVLQNDLLSGEGDIKSTALITELTYLAKEIEKDQALKECLVEVSAEEAYEIVQKTPKIAEQLQRYLEVYGVRCINEMKLESTPIKDDPLFCIAMIQNYLRNSIPDPRQQEQREKQIRKDAENRLRTKLSGYRLWVYRWVLKNARNAIKNRENQRFARTEAYSLVRTLVQSVGRQWEQKRIIEAKEDIFYLEIEEIWSYVEGTSTSVNLKRLIEVRKEEFASYHECDPDDHIETEGEVYYGNCFSQSVEQGEGEVIKGLGCCSGIVEGRAVVVLEPDKNLRLNGEIMVAKQTDPGWGILFPSIGGLIVEKGSMLSHSAIVAREMGIPAVIGVKGATKRFKSGDHIRINGTKGTVEFL